MHKNFWLNWLTALCVAALLGANLPRAEAMPLAQSANLILNGGFEATGGGAVATYWSPWWSEQAKPADGSYNYAYKPQWNLESLSSGAASAFVFVGNRSQRIINNWDPWWAGVKQIVTAPAGTRVRLTAYAKVWASNGNWPTPSDTSTPVSVQAGLEPNGSDNQFANTVVWSGSLSPYDTWQAVSVEATVGSSGRVGVFLSANYRGASRLFLAAFWDEASLVVVDTAPAATPSNTPAPAATATPVPTSMPTSTTTPVPTSAPTSTTTPVSTSAPTATEYIVQRGDSLGYIARRFGVSLSALIAANRITNANLIYVGQRLIIPGAAPIPAGSTIYIVQRGDTLTRIAARFGTTVQRLKQVNGLTSDLIFVGQRLIVS